MLNNNLTEERQTWPIKRCFDKKKDILMFTAAHKQIMLSIILILLHSHHYQIIDNNIIKL